MDTRNAGFGHEHSLPDDLYEIVYNIKVLDGHISFLKTWTDEIKDHIKKARTDKDYTGRTFSGQNGERQLRVLRNSATRVTSFDYAGFVKQYGAKEAARKGLIIKPPARPKSLRIGAALPGKKSLEWSAAEDLGVRAETQEYPQRYGWTAATPAQVAKGLFDLDQRLKGFEREKGELRGELLDQTLARELDDHLWGRTDGRVLLTPARPSYELPAGPAKDKFMAQHRSFVRYSERAASVTVGFYVPSQEL